MKPLAVVGLLLALVCAAPPRADALDVHLNNDRLTLRARSVPLRQILIRLAAEGVAVRIDPRINPDVTASYEDRDLRQALDAILKPYNHALIWEAAGDPENGRAGEGVRLAEIQIYREGEKKRMVPLAPARPLDVARNPRDGSFYVKNEILLKLKPGTDPAEFMKLLAALGGSVADRHEAAGIYRLRFPDGTDILALYRKLDGLPGVDHAEPNYAYPVARPYTFTGPARSALAYVGAADPNGAGAVAILDTGLSAYPGLEEYILASYDALNPDQPISDDLGHGTQMALIAAGLVQPMGTAAGTASHAPVISIKAFDENGFTSASAVMDSIEFAAANGARVLSLSWGSETPSASLENALNQADAAGMIIVASAGNEPTGKPVYPAAYPSVLGVGALEPDGDAWENSNYGEFVSIYAPGFATLPVGYQGDPGGYAGTSISAAYTANVISAYLSEHPEATKDEVIQYLSKHSGP